MNFLGPVKRLRKRYWREERILREMRLRDSLRILSCQLLGLERRLRIRVGGNALTIRTCTSDIRVVFSGLVDREFESLQGLRNVSVIVDAGANIGTSAIAFSELYPDATVLAVEPERENYEILCSNTDGLSNVRVLNAAVGSINGSQTLFARSTGAWGYTLAGTSESAKEVDQITECLRLPDLLSRYAFSHVSILKLDIEGGEKAVLEDSGDWIESVDILLAELHDRIVPGCTLAYENAIAGFAYQTVSGEKRIAYRSKECRAGWPGESAKTHLVSRPLRTLFRNAQHTIMTLPLVSIYIPVYNREHLIHHSIESVKAQSYKNWELIVIDDGSTDDTQNVVQRLTADVSQPVRYVHQENKGLFYSRNQAVALATGKYIAPLDSDDAWEPNHLSDFVQFLESHSEVDWVYGALRRINLENGETVAKSSFETSGSPKPFRKLGTRSAGKFKIYDDPSLLACSILYGIQSSQQTSLIRRSLFDDVRFIGTYRNCEDQQFVVRAIAHGKQLAYVNEIHLNYFIHDQNISCVAKSKGKSRGDRAIDYKKSVCVRSQLVELFELLRDEIQGDVEAEKALSIRLAREYFWSLGYNTHWQNAQILKALRCFAHGLSYEPTDWRYWKTAMAALIKSPAVAVKSFLAPQIR